MIYLYNLPRKSGKTSRVIGRMEENKDLYCIVPNRLLRDYYPEHLQNRVITYDHQ